MSTLINYDDVKVVGVTFENDDGSSRQKILAKTNISTPLSIDFYKYHGEPAYYVRNLKGEILGNLPKELSAEISEKYPNCSITAYVTDILGGEDGLSYGCRIHIDVNIYDETASNNVVHISPEESIKQANSIKLKNAVLKDDILTIFTDSGEKLYSDAIQNYSLRFYNVRTPIIGKIYLEVIFSHPAIDHPIILRAKENEPLFEKLKTFCVYMKKNAKVDMVKKRSQLIKPQNRKPILLAVAALVIIFLLFHGNLDNSIKSGQYTIDGITFDFSDSVRNDVTGKWRKSLVTTSQDVTQYAIDYYNTLFESDDEVHAIVNFTLNTTTSISVLLPGTLHVTVLEYVDGEEHDAKSLFGGMLLGEYFINIETGEVTEIQ